MHVIKNDAENVDIISKIYVKIKFNYLGFGKSCLNCVLLLLFSL